MLPATAMLMVTTVVVLALSWWFERKLALMPMVTAAIVLVFGGLTVWLDDELFIMLKPTIIYGLFAAVLIGGRVLGKPVLRKILGAALEMDEAGWRTLTTRFALFFVAMALGNEVVRNVASTDVWVLWKVPGSLLLTLAFMLAQGPMILRHKIPDGQ